MEEQGKIRMETVDFISRAEDYPAKRRSAPKQNERGNGRRFSRYLAARLGVCALVLAGVIGLKLAGETRALAVIGEMTEGRDDGSDTEETLGRLKFVELPSIAEVFARKPGAVTPCEAVGTEKAEGSALVFLTEKGSFLRSPITGRVKETGGEGESAFLSIASDDGSEFVLTGVAGGELEVGRPVEAGQRIGVAAASRLTVLVKKNGMPIDPAAVFGLG